MLRLFVKGGYEDKIVGYTDINHLFMRGVILLKAQHKRSLQQESSPLPPPPNSRKSASSIPCRREERASTHDVHRRKYTSPLYYCIPSSIILVYVDTGDVKSQFFALHTGKMVPRGLLVLSFFSPVSNK